MTGRQLNDRALRFVESKLTGSELLDELCAFVEGGGRVIDCGVAGEGGVEAGLFLARLTLCDLAEVSIEPG
ncbi:MAG TPA: methenyltetrahydromethanopterin cyclohydrolase, partial [Planctomycetes bacterium]|nr:methenyltetrahydromethanopterin cyclohydrolase [Planctomycetota bacterium]